MIGKAHLQWLDEATDDMIPVCECFFNKKGILYSVGTVFREDLLPVICKNSANLMRSMTDWLRIRDRWKLRPDVKLSGINDNLVTKQNNYSSPFDNYSFFCVETGEIMYSKDALNYPLQKECFLDGFCVYSREVNKDSLLHRLCLEADLSHVFEPGNYEIVKLNDTETLCWKTRIDKKYEYIPFIEYAKAFLSPSISKAQSVVRCCKHYMIPGWDDLFFELCSIDGISEIEKDLDSLFVMRSKADINHIVGLMIF